jgi:phosphoribosyl-dephospho-CoA transferase
MPLAAVQRRVTPQALRDVSSPRDVPALRALDQLRPLLAPQEWGVSGSAGFELASGIQALHALSDLDLILLAPQPLDRKDARALLAQLDTAPCAVDLQLQTPFGAVALREWAGGSRRVLLKTAGGALLVLDPWQAVA